MLKTPFFFSFFPPFPPESLIDEFWEETKNLLLSRPVHLLCGASDKWILSRSPCTSQGDFEQYLNNLCSHFLSLPIQITYQYIPGDRFFFLSFSLPHFFFIVFNLGSFSGFLYLRGEIKIHDRCMSNTHVVRPWLGLFCRSLDLNWCLNGRAA